MVVVTNSNGVVFINPKGVEYLGYSSAETILGDPSINFIHPDYREMVTKFAEERRAGGTPPSKYRAKLIGKDGKIHPVEFNVSFIIWGGEPSSLVIARDIEDQLEIEKELVQKNELLNNFMESATDGFNILDSNLNLIEINKVALDRFGFSKEDVIGKNITELRPDAIESGLVAKYEKVLETGKPYFDEFTIDTRETGFRHLIVKAFKVGKQLGVITTDITEQKQQENETQKSREQLYAFMESATDGLALFDKDMRLIEANSVWLNNADLVREQAIGKYVEKLFPTLAETGRLNAYLRVIDTGNPVEFRQIYAPRGGKRFLDIKAFKAGEGLGIISSDVTEDIEYNYMLEQLHQLSDSLSRAQNIEEIAEIVVETVTNTLNCKRVSFQTKTSNKIVIHAARPEISIREIPFDEPSIVYRVFKTGKPQHLPDTTKDPDYFEAISEDELPSLSEYAHPVKLRGETIAVINIEEPEKNAFTEQTIRLVSILADHVSAALHSQSYRDKLEKMHRGATYLASAESIEEVYEFTLNILEETLGYTWAGVAVVEENQLRYVRFSGSHPSGEPVIPLNNKSVTVRTVKTGKTQLVRDTRLDPDYVTLEGIYEPNLSELSVPVFIDDSVRLVLNQESREVDAFDKSDVRLVELLAKHTLIGRSGNIRGTIRVFESFRSRD
ncbi:PAS domain S-box protein [archaeon]|nr:PAS domain S-box protein [archaeon]